MIYEGECVAPWGLAP
ncbi:hypothetical protein BDFB_005767 [Asbolus verrucosus]|uniref:Uncharacterized protein n=1 Tax=Asbolus verrucosus TaxID=1661398 RepID=A0A482VID6_ASBVE|nr:hypothetical protein BDFB_005767 [Asbolus verrucosus]